MTETGAVARDLAQHGRDRLTVLQHELQLGEARLRELQQEQTQLQQTLLRISGAVQVLQELLDAEPSGDGPPSA